MKKKFDAVATTRNIRDKMARRYARNPELQMEDLRIIRVKYGFPETHHKIQKVAEAKSKYEK